jgi:hypothetical protein
MFSRQKKSETRAEMRKNHKELVQTETHGRPRKSKWTGTQKEQPSRGESGARERFATKRVKTKAPSEKKATASAASLAPHMTSEEPAWQMGWVRSVNRSHSLNSVSLALDGFPFRRGRPLACPLRQRSDSCSFTFCPRPGFSLMWRCVDSQRTHTQRVAGLHAHARPAVAPRSTHRTTNLG